VRAAVAVNTELVVLYWQAALAKLSWPHHLILPRHSRC
jgi:hypothetical protein